MVVWQLTGPVALDRGAIYFETKREASEWVAENIDIPERKELTFTKITVKNRADLAWELNNAIGFGG